MLDHFLPLSLLIYTPRSIEDSPYSHTKTYANTIPKISDLPQTMKAIKVVEPGKAEVQEVPLPRLRDDYILVKVKAVALNPTDWCFHPCPKTPMLQHRS